MVNYLSSVEKHTSNILYIAFEFCNDIVIPSWVDLDPCPNRVVMEANFRILKKVSMI